MMKSPRDVFGDALAELGAKNDNIIVLNADLASSTKTIKFQKKYPERHFNMGICEQNMMSVSAGLASEGYIPIVSTFAVFATGRAYDQIRQCIAYSNNNVKIAATHPGLAVGGDGATHQTLEDISLMRTMPNMTVLAPSDEVETKKAIEEAVKYHGPVYIRIGRAEMPKLHRDDYDFKIGKGEILREGTDITVVSHGIMTYFSLLAAEQLSNEGISLEVINMASIKPIDRDLILTSIKKTKGIVTIEDHSIYGGLGSAVAEVVVTNDPTPMEIIGVNDVFGESGTADELFKNYGLDVKSIKERIKEFFEKLEEE
ncbi:transketolase [Caloranaerobacter azorensis H53214]|uniref:Transketolase n=1 Tax=Caloranaerobacter azorensis H53214 TaxID=1156417 RepID=A0A096BEJ3_9FIRM|nr:transketolase family protein [Caloranaerobacter azorensis]KGG79550.1 transketolase [Caloranaerobacter azorensis H53214]